ncbi:sperm acrosome membrane-associated protein 4 [Salmo trutta]|uniref:Lymphocyte antigen-6, epidermis n=1 Tax=Salmo trutta TaxID=8032 RepID=A0A674EK26_SALTR|nr:sperm acrosome membrane-associated protein 4-like [Salmo trutta]
MNRIILSIFAVGLCFSVGQALQCYKCDLCIWNVFQTNVTCNAEEQCFSGVGKAAKFLEIKTKGCLNRNDCNKVTQTTFPSISNTTVYSVNKTCCSSDLCNAAPGLPRMSILHLALATTFMTKVLV